MSTDQMDRLILGVANQQTRQMSGSSLIAQLDTIATLFQRQGDALHKPTPSLEGADLLSIGAQFERHE
ncbi:hypothetical protein RBB50_011298 [Rhinocladiella similis]